MFEIPRALLTSFFTFISVYLLVSLFCVCVCECLVAKLNDLLGWARIGVISLQLYVSNDPVPPVPLDGSISC